MNKNQLYMLIVAIIIFSILASIITKVYFPLKLTGNVVTDSGTVSVNVIAGLGIAVDANYNVVNFGTVFRTVSYDTLSNNPKPILIRNDGSVDADVQICASPDFWLSFNRLASDFRFQVDVPGPGIFPLANGGAGADNCGLVTSNTCFTYTNTKTSPTNMPFQIGPSCSPVGAINNLKFANTNDEAELNILIKVPADEPDGAKLTTITLTGVDPATIP